MNHLKQKARDRVIRSADGFDAMMAPRLIAAAGRYRRGNQRGHSSAEARRAPWERGSQEEMTEG